MREVDWEGHERTNRRVLKGCVLFEAEVATLEHDLGGPERTRKLALIWHLPKKR